MIIKLITEKHIIQILQKFSKHFCSFSLFHYDNERVIECRFFDLMPMSRPVK